MLVSAATQRGIFAGMSHWGGWYNVTTRDEQHFKLMDQPCSLICGDIRSAPGVQAF